MKTILAAIVLLTANFAVAYENTSADNLVFISWCSDNNVIVNDKNGQNTILANCSDANLVCQESIRYAGRNQVGTASCVQK